MKKLVLLAAIIIPVSIVALLVCLWLTGSLFLRSPSAETVLNGVVLNRSEVYKSGNGDYLIFLNDNETAPKTYMIFSSSERFGIPTRTIPSSYSKSFKTSSFVLCYDCPATLAGTEKLDRNAKLRVLPKQIIFQLYEDSVSVKF